MLLLNLTLPTPQENLALDEAILDTADTTPGHPEVLRLWESPQPFVVLGRSSPFANEVNHEYCQANQVPVFRRCSGGATVVAGPGCLMYAVLLEYEQRPELRMLDVAHQFVMSRMMNAIKQLDIPVTMKGTCDLVLNDRKVSGNALRCKRNFLIYHGTFLTGLPIAQIANCLQTPARQPDYREQRNHTDFLGQLPTTSDQLKQAIIKEWNPAGNFDDWPKDLTQELAQNKYLDSDWTRKK
jgi:lipoate-protein ligase A